MGVGMGRASWLRETGAAAAALLAVAVYANTLDNGFVYDDRTVVLANPALRDARDWRAILLTPSWAPRTEAAIAYRPLSSWTLAVDRALHGDRPRGYHAANVALHAANAALVVLAAGMLGATTGVAVAAGVLFAVHPVHGEAVANVVGRAELLAACFALLAVCCHRRAAARGFGGAWPLGTLACFALALLAKEHAIALAVCLPLLDLTLVDGGRPGRFASAARGRRAALYGGLAVVTVLYLGLRHAILGAIADGPEAIAFWMNPAAHAPAPWRVLTALGVAARAGGLLVLPLRLRADYSFRQIEVVDSIADPWAVAGIAVAAAGIAALVAAWRRSATAAACLLLALGTYAVVSNVVLPIGTIFGERLLYLPSAGVCVLLAMAGARAASARPATVAVVAAAVVAWWSAVTWSRNVVWRDPTRFAETLVAEAPRSAHAHHVLGTTYAAAGRDDEAFRAFAAALAIDARSAGTLFNLAVLLQRRGDAAGAVARLEETVDADPAHVPAWLHLSLLQSAAERHAAALDAADRAVALRPTRGDTHMARAIALRGLGRFDDARRAVERGLALRPDEPRGLAELAQLALAQGDARAADAALARLAAVAPSRRAYAAVVDAYRRAGRGDDAERIVAQTTRAAVPSR